MRYYPKLGIFKTCNGNNQFDGHEARSYNWYVYAVVALDGTVYSTAQTYSNTTSKHEGQFHGLMGYDKPFVRILAPKGLGNLDAARRAIAEEVTQLRAELMNPRNRNRQGRLDKIADLEAMLPAIAALEADYAARRRQGKVA